MITALKALFAAILVSMLYVTTVASLDRSVFTAAAELVHDPWGRAALADAYFGFTTFFVWVAYREQSLVSKGLWLVLILILGNIAMATYVLIQLFRLPEGASVESLLSRPARP
jgi:hypothetical protein